MTFETDKDRKFNERVEAFLNSNDLDVIVLKGQLLIEQRLDALLAVALIEGGLKKLRKKYLFDYKSRVILAYAIGLIDEDERNILSSINTLRNSVGHTFEHETTENDVTSLKGLCDKLSGYFAADLSSYGPSDHARLLQAIMVAVSQLLFVRSVKLLRNPRKAPIARESSLQTEYDEIQPDLFEQFVKKLAGAAPVAERNPSGNTNWD